ncbi:toll/interleukin-1 receptor domain-containing protein [Clostridium thermobutyricum]|uniref:toll/interleukin-1 receptor domain-containing protein n=1 Tax=Clostridium thermobutyricum TaxID=29372 RepID=UPI0018A902D1|nr:toll/interleukin-1 receptor domain-containing protein [Clostridium thermobutyricum]
MKVFLSWSGEKSHKVALVLRDWLPSVLQSIKPYVSSEDIDKGARWSTDIAKELEDSTFGILCVTKENLNAPWLTFEAGALSKTMDKSYVTPFLVDIKRSEVSGPILQFQSTIFEKNDLEKLVKDLNKACKGDMLEESRLIKTFEVWYGELEKSLKKVIEETEDSSDIEIKEDNDEVETDIVEEVLEISRINQKLIRSISDGDTTSLSFLSKQINDLNGKVEEINKRIFMIRSNSKRSINYREYENFSMTLDPEFRAYILLSILKEEIPGIYEYGNNIIQDIRNGQKLEITYRKIEGLESILKEFVYINKYSDRVIRNVRITRGLDINEVVYNLRDSLMELIDNNKLLSNSIV